jgi:hypothetical protein
MPAEAIAGAAGNEAKRGVVVHEGLCDLIHRAIAADGHDQAAAVVKGAAGEFGGVERALGNDEIRLELVLGDKGMAAREQGRIVLVATGTGIENEPGL